MVFNKETKRRAKSLLGPFIIIFFVAFFSLNWSSVSWLFNGRYLFSVLSHSFSTKKMITRENSIPASVYAEKEDSIFIPEIQVQAPFVFSSTDKPKDMAEALKKGVLHYPHSALPGEKGKVIILGHSAPPGWPRVNHYHVFNKLDKLKKGDNVFVYFKNSEYRYQVTGRFFVRPGTKIESLPLTNSENMLFLLSCWPPGKSLQRVVIEARQII